MTRWSTENAWGTETTRYEAVMMDIRHQALSKPIECTTPGVNPSGN